MRASLLIVLLALTACTSEPRSAASPPAGTRSPSPPPASTAAPSSAASSTAVPSPADLLLAVGRRPGELLLYAVAAGTHEARLARRLEGPAGMTVERVSLAAGPAPVLCAVWHTAPNPDAEPSAYLHCYRPGATRGRVVASEVKAAAVRPDGRALSWVEYNSDGPLVVADLVGDTAKERSREPYVEGGSPEGGVPSGLTRVAWLGPRSLAVTDDADSDDGRGVCVVDLERPRGSSAGVGFGRCMQPRPEESLKGFDRFEGAVAVEDGVIVTVERAMWCCGERTKDPGARAVRLRVADRTVVDVVATPREGRDVVDVSGGRRAVLYVTGPRAGGPVVVSLRWAGDAHGAPVTGLPPGVSVASAQP